MPTPHRAFVPFVVAAVLMLAANDVRAAEYFLDPTRGRASNSGTRTEPLGSLAEVAASDRTFAAGDVLILLAGHHGAPVLRTQNPGVVTVRPDPGARVTLRQLTIQNARNWHVLGLEISPSLESPYQRVTMVSITGGSDNTVEDCNAYSVPDSSAWSATEWDTLSCNGANVSGTRNTVRGCHFRNVNFGISTSNTSTHCRVERNVVENIAGDGLRGIGDYSVFEYNVVKNCYAVNANHDDGFQSWSTGSAGPGTGTVRGVVVRGNWILSYEDPNQPHRGSFQGIGCFDGVYEDWVVENNVIITDAWHGIAFYGARNCRIVNNTVVDRTTVDSGVPWIMVTAHKNGTPSTGNIVRNNLTSDLRTDSGSSTVDHNLVSRDYARLFRDWAMFDLHLAPSSPAIDAGSSALAPAIDGDALPRPIDGDSSGSAAWDIGAYEYAGIVPLAPTELNVAP